MSYPGMFISLEGVDGCGKSTQIELVGKWLAGRFQREVVVTHEPGATKLGKALRQLIQHGDDMDARTEALLYAADRANHVAEVVEPALQRGAIVITDRYLDSSVAYQAAGRQLPAADVEYLSRWATQGLMPDVTILLDIDPAIARARQVGEMDRIEKAGLEFQQRVRAGYQQRVAADPARWLVISGMGTPAEVEAAIISQLEPKLVAWENRADTDSSSLPTQRNDESLELPKVAR